MKNRTFSPSQRTASNAVVKDVATIQRELKQRKLRDGVSDGQSPSAIAFNPGPFPLDALNETMRAIAVETAEVHQIPIELTAIAALATLSGALGTSREVTGAVNGKR